MKAIILAAGRGSRMGNRTKVLPKCLTPLLGKSLLEWQISALRGAGIEEIAVVTGYQEGEIRKRFPSVVYFHNDAWMKTNMVATLLKAEAWLQTDSCVVSYADILYTTKAVVDLVACEDDMAISYYTKFLALWQERFENPLDDIETFKIDENSFLTEIGGKPVSLSGIEGQYMGLLKFTSAGWRKLRQVMAEGLPKSVELIDMTGLLSHLLSKGQMIRAVAYDGIWLEVDSEKDVVLYETRLTEQHKKMIVG